MGPALSSLAGKSTKHAGACRPRNGWSGEELAYLDCANLRASWLRSIRFQCGNGTLRDRVRLALHDSAADHAAHRRSERHRRHGSRNVAHVLTTTSSFSGFGIGSMRKTRSPSLISPAGSVRRIHCRFCVHRWSSVMSLVRRTCAGAAVRSDVDFRADHMDASGCGAGRNTINRGAFFQAQNAPTQAKTDRSRSGWQAE